MEILKRTPGSFGSNCYLLLSRGEAAIIDPSVDAKTLLQEIEARGARLSMILLTHGHFDHIFALDDLRDRTGVPAFLHASDATLPTDAQKNAFGIFFGVTRVWRKAEKELSDGDVLSLGDETIEVLHTPGHTAGSVCYRVGNVLFSGDTLFSDNVGRHDLFGGDAAALRASLQRLSSLPKDLTICPGHGPDARLGEALLRVCRY